MAATRMTMTTTTTTRATMMATAAASWTPWFKLVRVGLWREDGGE
jgi:hypothetical protein